MRSIAAVVAFLASMPLLGIPRALAEPLLEGLQVEVFGQYGDRTLLGSHRPVPPDSSPESLPQSLYERSAQGELRLLAEGVSYAAYAPDGAVFFVQDDGLFEFYNHETRLIARPVMGDFAIDPLGRTLALVRPDAEPDTWIELVDRLGNHLSILSEPSGPNGWPMFSPDGAALFFISARTGVYSWFRVDSSGENLVQLTNRELRPGPDILGDAFVPPPISKSSIHFLGPSHVEYETGEGLWRLDLDTGAALETRGGSR